MTGFFALGVYHPRKEVNVGSVWRTAHLYGAAFVFTIGRQYSPQASDTPKTPLSTPLFHFDSMMDLVQHRPRESELIGIELSDRSVMLPEFVHPPRGIYLLGAESHGIPERVLNHCDRVVQIPSMKAYSMNVANAGAIITYDRFSRSEATSNA